MKIRIHYFVPDDELWETHTVDGETPNLDETDWYVCIDTENRGRLIFPWSNISHIDVLGG
jgi:hypothetical protein